MCVGGVEGSAGVSLSLPLLRLLFKLTGKCSIQSFNVFQVLPNHSRIANSKQANVTTLVCILSTEKPYSLQSRSCLILTGTITPYLYWHTCARMRTPSNMICSGLLTQLSHPFPSCSPVTCACTKRMYKAAEECVSHACMRVSARICNQQANNRRPCVC